MPETSLNPSWSDEPVRPSSMSIGYWAGLVFVALMMVLLPLIYVGFCVAAGYGIYLYAINETWLLRYRTPGIAAYLGVILAGGIGLVFMMKPLFFRRPGTNAEVVITEQSQPEIFRLVEGVCDRIGAPRPVKVVVTNQVNASAGFEKGLWGFFTNRLVLTIGLPLAQGLTVSQFGGVIAHEFGHFTQATAMRLNYIIWSINRWFHRVIYERDSLDAHLTAWTKRGNIYWVLMANIAVVFVWLARRVLWLLMMAGHAVSAYMMRQMEYDADHYEVEVAGRTNFKETFFKMHLLNVGSQQALQQLREMWKKKQVVDNLSLLTGGCAASIPRAQVEAYQAKFESNRGAAAWHATHPSDYQRIKQKENGRDPGVLCGDEPASSLFSDLEQLARNVTLTDYAQRYDLTVKPDNIVSTAAYLEQRADKEARLARMRVFLGELISDTRFVYPSGTAEIPAEWDQATAYLAEITRSLSESLPANEEAERNIQAARARRAKAFAAQALMQIGVPVKPAQFDLADFKRKTIQDVIDACSGEIEQREAALAAPIGLASAKLFLICRLAEGYAQAYPEIDADGVVRRLLELERFLGSIRPIEAILARQRKAIFTASLYVTHFGAARNKKKASALFESVAAELGQVVEEIVAEAKPVGYPLHDGKSHADLAAYFMAGNNQTAAIGRYHYLASIYERYAFIYSEVMLEFVEKLSVTMASMGLQNQPGEVA